MMPDSTAPERKIAQHTPAPWQAFEMEDGHDIRMATALEMRHGGYQPQHVISYEHGLEPGESETQDAQYDEAFANANLIAAAPDLLAALIGLDGLLADVANEPELDSEHLAAINAARAAIAKAEARSDE